MGWVIGTSSLKLRGKGLCLLDDDAWASGFMDVRPISLFGKILGIMILLVDESVDRQIVDRLREDGHTVSCVAEMDPGISDDAVLSFSQ
jgi:hypothetical protein